MTLTCPKCQGTMRSYERNGVTLDQCGDCRGLFLDRGELERLVDAETAWHAGGETPRGSDDRPSVPVANDRDRDDRYRDSDRDRHQDDRYRDGDRDRHRDRDDYRGAPSYGYGSSGHKSGHKRPKSFLEQLFD